MKNYAFMIKSIHDIVLIGVGPKEDLEQLNIPVYSNLRVGYNLHDHVSMAGLTFTINQPITILEENVRHPRYFLDYVINNKGPYTLPAGAEGIAFVKTNITYLRKYLLNQKFSHLLDR